MYLPSEETSYYLKQTSAYEIALNLPNLNLPKTKLDSFSGEVGEKIKCDFSG